MATPEEQATRPGFGPEGGHLWLIGMMGSGKTSVGRRLAGRLQMGFVDIDEVVAATEGRSIAELWEETGEAAFRSVESAALQGASRALPAVVATGGGAVIDPSNRDAIRKTGLCVWLTAAPETLARRVAGDQGRPLLRSDATAGRFGSILAQRAAIYAATADLAIDTDAFDHEEVVDRIEAWWNGF